jgi:hypothetical protein
MTIGRFLRRRTLAIVVVASAIAADVYVLLAVR